jgi:hypothetical protein
MPENPFEPPKEVKRGINRNLPDQLGRIFLWIGIAIVIALPVFCVAQAIFRGFPAQD